MATFAPGTGAGLAEVARLITELELRDELTPGLTTASRQAAAYGQAADKAQAKTTFLGRSMKGASGAMTHFGSRVSQTTQLLGAGGLLGGVLGVTLAVKQGIGMAEQWGKTTDRLKQLTGASTKEASQFADAYDKLGISQDKQIRIMGFLSKALGNWNVNRKQAKQIEKDYGFSLIDSNGKMKDALTVTQDFTSYFNNKHIPSYQKASLGAKLFGRGWTDMIPVFEKGEKAMRRAMKDAMAMSPEQLKDLHKWRDAQRDLNDSVGDLQVKIGLAAIPALTQLSRGITDFVDKNERKIRLLFGQGLEAAQDFAGFVAHDVAPTLVNLVSSAVGFWNAIPGPLRDILLKGFVADRAIKFAFGFSITGLATDAIKDAIGGGLSRVFGRGSSPATPMYVKPVGVGLGGGGGAGVPGGGMGRVGKGLLALEGIAIAGAVASTVNDFMTERSQEQAELAEKAKGVLGDTRDKAMDDITNMTRLMLKESDPAEKAGIQTFASKELGSALLNAAKVLREETVSKEDIPAALAKMSEAQKAATEYGWTQVAADIGKEMKDLQEGRGGQSAETGARKTNKLLSEQKGVWAAYMRQMGRAERTRDRGQERAFDLLKDGIAGEHDDASAVRRAIKVMEREQKQATERGATRMARNIGRDIAILKRATQGGLDRAGDKLGTIAAKPPPVVNVTTNVTAQVGVRDVERATTTVSRYGRGPVAV